jgi:hypothetical protein
VSAVAHHTHPRARTGDILASLGGGGGDGSGDGDGDGAQDSADEASDGEDAEDAGGDAAAEVEAEPRSGQKYNLQAALEAGVIFEASDLLEAACWVEAIIDTPDVSATGLA